MLLFRACPLRDFQGLGGCSWNRVNPLQLPVACLGFLPNTDCQCSEQCLSLALTSEILAARSFNSPEGDNWNPLQLTDSAFYLRCSSLLFLLARITFIFYSSFPFWGQCCLHSPVVIAFQHSYVPVENFEILRFNLCSTVGCCASRT